MTSRSRLIRKTEQLKQRDKTPKTKRKFCPKMNEGRYDERRKDRVEEST